MSDDEEYEYDYGSDGYNYESDGGGGDAEGGDAAEDELVEIENAFYEGDDKISSDPKESIELFEKVVKLETDRGNEVKWRFKALQHLVSLNFSLKNYPEMIQRYRDMLIYMSSVSRNECTDAINAILSTISTASTNSASGDVLSEVYEITLLALKSSNNERLWFNTNHKLAKLYLEAEKFSDVERLITVLKDSCLNADGSDDMTKGTNLLEIACLEIQLCSITNNFSRMKIIYPKTKKFGAAVSDPRIMGVMREEGGKMFMSENKYTEAFNDLYDAFKCYQLAGNARAKDMLKYVVLASMLAQSDINPFAAQEAMVYCDDKEIVAMKNLREALESNDLKNFEKILKNKRNRISDEPFLMKYIEPLREQMHKLVLLNLTKPYKKVKVEFLAKELSLTESEIEHLLVSMILDEKLHAQIDQINGIVLLGGVGESSSIKKLDLLSKWADRLSSVNDSMGNRITN